MTPTLSFVVFDLNLLEIQNHQLVFINIKIDINVFMSKCGEKVDSCTTVPCCLQSNK